MKIVYILKSFAIKAGTERVISDKMNFLAEQGYEVTLVTYEQGNHPKAYNLNPSINCVDLNTRFFEIGKYGFFKRMKMYWQLRHQFRIRLQHFLDELQPDVIISTTYSMNLLDIILSVKTNARIIIESHVACYTEKKSYGYRNKPVHHFIVSIYDNWMFKKVAKAELLVVLTTGDASDWHKYTSCVRVIPNPITVYPQSVLRHDGSGHRIICVGRLQEQKGFDMLIDAFALIANKCLDWKIDIYGDGPDKLQLIEKIKNNKMDNRIVINPPTNMIYEEYQKSEFFVLSSRFEGFPLVLGEAMSCGIPCVAFNCKYGPEDIIRNNENGLLVENGNIKELSEKILWMIEHVNERLHMGQIAREDIQKCKKEIVMQKWIDLFDENKN